MQLQPIGDHVIIKRLDAPDKTKGGIIMPDVAKEKPRKGKVVAVGPGAFCEHVTAAFREVKYAPMEVSPGDVVYYGYGGMEVNVDGEEFTVLRSSDILAAMK